MTTRMFRCSGVGVSKEDRWRSGAWMLGGCLGMMLMSMALHMRFGDNAMSEALLYGAFPASLMLSNECTYFRPYSRGARLTMALGGALLIILIMWASVAVADRI